MNLKTFFAKFIFIFLTFFVAGCSIIARPSIENNFENIVKINNSTISTEFRGRLALKIEAEPGSQQTLAQMFSGGFELVGNAQTGVLTLYSPLGGTVAALSWRPGDAHMEAGQQVRQFNSLAEMLAHATGADLPVASLFAWLQGENASAPGWAADLSQFANGKIVAKRAQPPPQIELRVILDTEPKAVPSTPG